MKFLIACILLYTLRAGLLSAQVKPFQDPEATLWGLKRGTHTVRTPVYDYIAPFNRYGLAVVLKNGSYGIADTSGRERIPARYAFISYAEDTTFIVQKSDKEGRKTAVLLDLQGRELSGDSILFRGAPQGNYLHVFRAHTKSTDNQGMIDRQGRFAVPMKYRQIDVLDGSFIVQDARGSHLFREGKKVDIAVKYDLLRPLSRIIQHTLLPAARFATADHSKDRVLVYESDGHCGLLDIEGRVLCKAVYHDIEPFSDGLARVRINNHYGYINRIGKEVVPLIYEAACSFSGGFAVVMKDGKTGLLHCSGKEILHPVYRDIPGRRMRPGTAGLISFAAMEEPLYIEPIRSVPFSNPPEIPWDIRHKDPVSEGMTAFCNDSACGYADTTGNIVVPPVYQSVSAFREGRAAVQQNGRWGYIGNTGRIVIPCIYDLAEDFRGGTALVRKGRKYGLIGRNGDTRIPFRPKAQTRIGEQLIRIYANRRMYILKNTDGVLVFGRHSAIMPTADSGYYHVTKKRKHGIIRAEGRLIVPMRYTYVDQRLLPYFFTVARGRGKHKKYGLCNREGHEVLPPLYDKPPQLYQGIISAERNGENFSWNLSGKPISVSNTAK